MSEEKGKQIIEFVPFGTKDKIQLSIEIVKRLVAVKTKTGKSCSDEEAFKFMLMCQARKLNPFEGDAYLIGYDGQQGPTFSLITAHQAFLKRAELHPEFDGMESGTIVQRKDEQIDLLGDWHMPNDQILGGWATVYFKNRSHPMKKRLRLARFNKNYGIWRDDPAGMIVKCAEADALRSSFPTMLGGMFIREEMPPEGTEIAKPVFPEPPADAPPKNNEPKKVEATVVEQPERKPPAAAGGDFKLQQEPAVESKKKPTLTRKSASQKAPSGPTTTTEKPREATPHERLSALLAVGNCMPQDFVQLAIDEGWIDVEMNDFSKIPAERIVEFLKDENWSFIMQLLDERQAKRSAEQESRQ